MDSQNYRQADYRAIPNEQPIYLKPFVSPALHGFAFLLFFLPFVEIRCGNRTITSFSGMEIATGTGIGKSKDLVEHGHPYLWMILALVGVVFAAAIHLYRHRNRYILSFIGSAVAVVCLLLTQLLLKNDIPSQASHSQAKSTGSDDDLFSGLVGGADNVVSLNFTAVYWFVLILLIGGAILNVLTYQELKRPLGITRKPVGGIPDNELPDPPANLYD